MTKTTKKQHPYTTEFKVFLYEPSRLCSKAINSHLLFFAFICFLLKDLSSVKARM